MIGCRHIWRLRQIFEMHQVLVEPLAIGTFGHDLGLDLGIVDDAALLGVDQEHAARLQAALLQNPLGRNIEHASLRGHDDQAILRHVITRGTQAIAVEHRADLPSIRERNRSRSVPRFHQAGMKLVERPPVIVHGFVVRPGFRNHHHHRMGQRPPGEHEQLEGVVEHGRVAAIRIDDGEDLRDILAERLGDKERLPGMHPVDVAPQRVDLAVMREIAVGMGAVPARESVRAETGVHQRKRRLHRWLQQIGEVAFELRRQEHALVNKGLVRQAAEVPELGSIHRRGADLVMGALADDVEFALERHGIGQFRAATNKHLAYGGFARPGGLSERGIVGRHRAPAEDRLSFRLDDLLEAFLQAAPLRDVLGEKHQTAAIPALFRQRDPRLFADLLEKAMGHLQQHSRTVAGVGFAAARTAMIEVGQHLERLLQNLVRSTALDVDHEAHAARVVFEPGVVETLLGRQPGPGWPRTGSAVTSVVHFSDTAGRRPWGQWQTWFGDHGQGAVRRPRAAGGRSGREGWAEEDARHSWAAKKAGLAVRAGPEKTDTVLTGWAR